MKKLLMLAVALSVPTFAAGAADGAGPAREAAETYLHALTSASDSGGKDLLLGGVTLDAQLFTLENGTILSEDPVRRETGELKGAVSLMRELDRAGAAARRKMLGHGPASAAAEDDVTLAALSKEDAARLLAPTRQRALRFKKTHPVLAYVARADKEIYWHPKNPIRQLLAQTSGQGTYTLEVHRYLVESREGAAQTKRTWPLRVLRFTAPGVDTGWKVLPASDWSTE